MTAMPHRTGAGFLTGIGVAVVMMHAGAAWAADHFYAYDLTTATSFNGMYLAPVGTQKWGANQALNDKDKVLDPSERLTLTGLQRGHFDVKMVDAKGQVCIKHDVDLTHDLTFDIRDADIQGCR